MDGSALTSAPARPSMEVRDNVLGSSTMRYEHDWLARRGEHDRPVHPPDAEAKATEHIAKDAKYYRRRGAYWVPRCRPTRPRGGDGEHGNAWWERVTQARRDGRKATCVAGFSRVFCQRQPS